MAIRQRILKDGQVHFYEGSKKATPQAVKEYFKENLDRIDRSVLSKRDRQVIGGIKAGALRAKNSIRTEGGKFVSAKFLEEKLKGSPINLKAFFDKFQAKNITELFQKQPQLKDPITKIVNETTLSRYYNTKNILDKIMHAGVDNFEFNGKSVTKLELLSLVEQTISAVRMGFDNVVDISALFKFKGLNKLSVKMPSLKNIEDAVKGGTIEKLIKDYFQIYFS